MNIFGLLESWINDHTTTDHFVFSSNMSSEKIEKTIYEYLEDHLNRYQQLSEEIQENKRKMQFIQQILKKPSSILLRLSKMNEKQRMWVSGAISASDLNIIQHVICPTTSLRCNSSQSEVQFAIDMAKQLNILLQKINIKQDALQQIVRSDYCNISQITAISQHLKNNELYRFSKKQQEMIRQVLNTYEDGEELLKASDYLFYLAEQKYQKEQQEKEYLNVQSKIVTLKKKKEVNIKKENDKNDQLLEKLEIETPVEIKPKDYKCHIEEENYWNSIKTIEHLSQLEQYLPKYDYSNYRDIMKYLLKKVKEEMDDYLLLVDSELEEEKEVIDNQISFLSNMFEILKNHFVQYYHQYDDLEQVNHELSFEKNQLFFVEKKSGTPYLLSDLESNAFNKERLTAVKKLLLQLQQDTFPRDEKHFRKFSNNKRITKYFNVYELKDYQTRLLFTYVGPHKIAVIMAFCKKTDNSVSILNTVSNRMIECSNKIMELKEWILNDEIPENYLKKQEALGRQLTK